MCNSREIYYDFIFSMNGHKMHCKFKINIYQSTVKNEIEIKFPLCN